MPRAMFSNIYIITNKPEASSGYANLFARTVKNNVKSDGKCQVEYDGNNASLEARVFGDDALVIIDFNKYSGESLTEGLKNCIALAGNNNVSFLGFAASDAVLLDANECLGNNAQWRGRVVFMHRIDIQPVLINIKNGAIADVAAIPAFLDKLAGVRAEIAAKHAEEQASSDAEADPVLHSASPFASATTAASLGDSSVNHDSPDGSLQGTAESGSPTTVGDWIQSSVFSASGANGKKRPPCDGSGNNRVKSPRTVEGEASDDAASNDGDPEREDRLQKRF